MEALRWQGVPGRLFTQRRDARDGLGWPLRAHDGLFGLSGVEDVAQGKDDSMRSQLRIQPRRLAALIALLAALGTQASAQGKEDPAKERLMMGAVGAVLEQAHIAEQPLDDAVSRRAFKRLLQVIDPLRLYFYQSDVDEFARRRNDLDDMMRSGTTKYPMKVWNRFIKRVDERMELVDRLLAGEFDFEIEESFASDRDDARFPTTSKEASDLWRKRIKSSLLSIKSNGVDLAKAKERVGRRFTRFRDEIKREDREDILARFINAVATSYDPHTVYLAPKSFEDFNLDLTLNYKGIGALLGEDDDGAIVIRQIFPGGGAAADGILKAQDKIIAVGQGKEGDYLDVVGMRVNDVVKHIRGEEGTFVRLRVIPAEGGAPRIHVLPRQRILLEDRAASSKLSEVGEGASKIKVGTINLPAFYRDNEAAARGDKDFHSSTEDLRKILKDYEKQSVDAVVLDLRRNGGGFLPEAIGVAGLFIDQGVVVQVKGSDRRVRKLRDRDEGVAWSGPLVVLTSKGSASASEIVAGAIRDYRRGIVVGDSSTHGKGTVQTPIDLTEVLSSREGAPALGVLKTTIQKFYLPNGDSTQLRGVPADVVIPSWTEVLEEGEGSLPHALDFDRIKRAGIKAYDLNDAEIAKTLSDRSKKRRSASDFFKGLVSRIEAFRRYQESSIVPLKEADYIALQKELDQAEDAASSEGAAPSSSEGEGAEAGSDAEATPKADLWFDELLAITADYVDLLRRRRA